MSSVPSANPGVANLLELLSNSNSAVLTSKKVTTALEKAPTSDIVQLSMSAIQAQSMNALFGTGSGTDASTATSTSTNAVTASLADLLSGSTGATASSTDTTASSLLASAALTNATPADQLAYYQSAAQAAQTQGIFNAESFGSQSGSLLNVVG